MVGGSGSGRGSGQTLLPTLSPTLSPIDQARNPQAELQSDIRYSVFGIGIMAAFALTIIC